ncbi:PREDICTED: uncharacterized protein LOC109192001 [Ipomoea nil]|uniref:uncharacterized protein LOC109192001 n=1 Tax=Ipomoea nil TaxID=35883 RepID=UPI000901048F|nr:PREDICTED: uncharacterized protein LOC109192001 [Ipomoea nil]
MVKGLSTHLIAGQPDADEDQGWVWRIWCVERVKLFLWKIMKNGLLVNGERRRRSLTEDSSCPWCGDGEESLDHLFRRCEFAMSYWNLCTGLKARNNWLFNNTQVPASEVVRRSMRKGLDSFSLSGTTLNTDGARKAKSGMASADGTIRDHNGVWIVGFTTKIGITSSFFAELWDLKEGLSLVKDRGMNKIIV